VVDKHVEAKPSISFFFLPFVFFLYLALDTYEDIYYYITTFDVMDGIIKFGDDPIK
jgi:hypothetical protein